MKKRQIGNAQLIIGIIILIIGIIGLLFANSINTKMKDKQEEFLQIFSDDFKQSENRSDEINFMVATNYINQIERINYNYTNRIISIVLSSLIMIFLSLIFITQGLLNKSK